MTSDPRPAARPSESTGSPDGGVLRWVGRAVTILAGLILAGVLTVFMAVGIALAVAYPNLPDVADLADYRPKLPLRVFTADGVLIGEFGEERRNLLTINEIPDVMKNAVLAI